MCAPSRWSAAAPAASSSCSRCSTGSPRPCAPTRRALPSSPTRPRCSQATRPPCARGSATSSSSAAPFFILRAATVAVEPGTIIVDPRQAHRRRPHRMGDVGGGGAVARCIGARVRRQRLRGSGGHAALDVASVRVRGRRLCNAGGASTTQGERIRREAGPSPGGEPASSCPWRLVAQAQAATACARLDRDRRQARDCIARTLRRGRKLGVAVEGPRRPRLHGQVRAPCGRAFAAVRRRLMSPKGRPEGESAPKREARSAQGSPMSPKGRPEGESAPKRVARRVVP